MSSRARRGAGFTLLEILVVVAIIGILATAAVMAIGSRSLDDRLDTEARRLHQLLLLAADEAVLQGVELGFAQGDGGYGFLALKDGKWLPLEDGPLRRRALQEPFFIELQVDGRRVPPARADAGEEEPRPQLLFLSSGEATEFTLDLRAEKFVPHYRLRGDVLGQLQLERRDAS